MAAMTAKGSQTFIAARHRLRLARNDVPGATAVTARELACLFYTLVTAVESHVMR